MKPIALIRASSGLAAAELLKEIGAPVDRIWGRAGLPALRHLEPDRLVPFHMLRRFLEDAAADQGVADLGLRVAQRSGIACAGSFGDFLLRAPTLYGVLEAARLGVSRHNSAAQYWTVVQGDSVRFCRRFAGPERDFRQADLLTVSLMASIVRAVAGPQWQPTHIELQSAGAPDFGGCEDLAAASVQVARPVTSITFPRLLLGRTMPRPSGPLPPARWSEGWLTTAPPADFLTSLEVVIGTLLGTPQLDVRAAALAAGSSVRSLQRRLTELGVSYTEIVDRVRFRVASDLLRDDSVKIIEIAFAAGYSDPAHFTRAFRRWTSLTPVEYRRAQRAGALERERA